MKLSMKSWALLPLLLVALCSCDDTDEPGNGSNYTEKAAGVDFDMIYVEGGIFAMGSDNGDGDEQPIHNVTLSSYYIGKYEVTQELWEAVMGRDVIVEISKNFGTSCVGDNYPIYYIDREQMTTFCMELSRLTGKKYRLPTEAEWEYAARGGKESKGYVYSGSNDVGEVAWYKSNANTLVHPVGRKKSNELGIYDMSGNMWEWCSDWYDGYYYANSPTHIPKGAEDGEYHVLRGGSWAFGAESCRITDRDCQYPTAIATNFGFRVVREL